MRKVLSWILLMALVINCAPKSPQYVYDYHERQYPIAISEMVGDIIDPEEREQFGLFLGIEDFKEAQFYVISGGGYEVEISTATKRLVSVNRDRDALIVLRDYIENHEEIINDRAAWESRWGILDYDALGFPIRQNEAESHPTYGRATACGCAAGLVAAIAFGALVAASLQEDASGMEMGGGIAIMMIGLGGALAVGLLTGCLTGFSVHKQDTKKKGVEKIKEMRKPRVVE